MNQRPSGSAAAGAQAASVTQSCHTECEQRPQHGSAAPISDEEWPSTGDSGGAKWNRTTDFSIISAANLGLDGQPRHRTACRRRSALPYPGRPTPLPPVEPDQGLARSCPASGTRCRRPRLLGGPRPCGQEVWWYPVPHRPRLDQRQSVSPSKGPPGIAATEPMERTSPWRALPCHNGTAVGDTPDVGSGDAYCGAPIASFCATQADGVTRDERAFRAGCLSLPSDQLPPPSCT